MKKFLALAALILGMVSCQNDFDDTNVIVGGEQLVNITVGLPEATRAASGSGFDLSSLEGSGYELRYILEIYVNGDSTDCIRQEAFTTATEAVVFPVRLVPERDYRVVAWADIVPAVADRTAEGDYDYYYETSNGLDEVTIIENANINIEWNAMDEYRDAYTAFDVVEDFTANTAIDLELKRPFAKVRVVSTDIKDIEDLGFQLKNGTVNYTVKLNRTYDALYGRSSNEGDKDHAFTYPTPYAGDAYETETRRTLFADYIFVDNIAEQDAIQFTLSVYAQDGLLKTTTFNTDIALHANTLTTIIGEVLTEGGNVQIEINGELNEVERYTVVSSASHLLNIVNAGGDFMLGNHIIVTADDVNEAQGIITRAAGEAKTTTVNLNGYTVTFVNDTDEPLITVAEGNSLTIVDEKGTGAIILEGDGTAIVNNGTLNIEGGSVASNDNGTVIVNNGEANIKDATLNEGAVENNGTTNVNGGDVADGAIENTEDAIVGTYVYTAEELQAAINAAEVDLNNEVSFGADIVGDVTILQKEGVNLIINGREYEFDGVITVNGGGRANGNETLTFKAINFATEGSDFTFISAPSKINGAYNYSHNVTIESCTFNGNQTVGSASFTGTYNFVMKNCKATSMHSILQLQSVDNKALVEYVETVNCKNGLSFGNTAYPTLKNSTIKASEYGVRADGDASRGALLLEDNTIEANVPVIVRKTTTKYGVTLVNNDITKGGLFEVVFTNGKDDEAYVAPTGTYTITGAEDYIVYPREYPVYNAEQLAAAMAANENVKLFSDIDLANVEWTPVGSDEAPFKGSFDGNGKKISNLTVADREYVAFISHTDENVTIKNLTLENVNLVSTKHAAGVVCVAGSGLTLENVKVYGTIEAASYAGGIMHNGANATIKNCENHASVTANRAGGIASWVTVGANIENVVNYGDITGAVGASGIAHGFAGKVKNAVNHGNISSAYYEAAGGIVGVQKAASTYEYCYNYGAVTSTYDDVNASAAGILGQSAGSTSTIKYCANYGDITAENSYAAGIAYSLYGSINASFCYNEGAVNGADGAGAIAPKAAYGSGDKASYCLNAGVVESTAGTVYQGANNNVSNYYYDGNELRAVANNAVVAVADALAVLNGGDDANFFEVKDGVITVK